MLNSGSLGANSKRNGIGGIIGTTTSANTKIEGCRMQNVTLSSATGANTACAMILAYIASDGATLTGNGVSGSVNGVVLDESSLNSTSLLYFAEKAVNCTGTYIIR